ncbi:S8 family peptidase [Hyphomonas sp.]|uniref:S8 family peptidase n=1 Tax=Hyphomonas sp. TaxID=87 RepID=UPI0025B810B0|nr:S8 family peptidase [Hyphomonas sp.]
MVERPILKLPEPRQDQRKKSNKQFIPKRLARTPTRARQGERLSPRLAPLVKAFEGDQPSVTLKEDPAGIAPERALVFETATSIQNFAKVAVSAGFDVFAEFESDSALDLREGDFAPPKGEEQLFPTLYATMPSEGALRQLLALWRRYKAGKKPTRQEALMPWWNMFDQLVDLRLWGPEDRFTERARQILESRLPDNDDDDVLLELEIWPSANDAQRAQWRQEAKAAVDELEGRIIDESQIRLDGFVYDAVLVALRAGDVRELIKNPRLKGGLASVHGIQFILPQTIAQSSQMDDDPAAGAARIANAFDPNAPMRAILLDSVPVAAHPQLDGGVVIEDLFSIEPISVVAKRYHGTAMASLILRGDIESDGTRLQDSRLLCIPVLVDGADGRARSQPDKLFVDILHAALARCFLNEEPLAPDAFLVNLSIGVSDQRFAGRISAIARLLDWWSWKYGVLFAVSAGNIPEELDLPGITATAFEDCDQLTRQSLIRRAIDAQAYERSLLSPAEALNALTVGAYSIDATPKTNPHDATLIRFENAGEHLPHVSTAIGLGPKKALKPDLLAPGGVQEMRIKPNGVDTRLGISDTHRTGLVVAAPNAALGTSTTRCRGTSPATALTTRALLQAAQMLTEQDGPFEGQELPRRDLALATRALAVNAAMWPTSFQPFEAEAKSRFGTDKSHTGVKDQIARHFGHGVLEPIRMIDGPQHGATLIGLGTTRKDRAQLFRLALPPSLSGQKLPRHLRITLAWFSPVSPTRALYRCAALEAVCLAETTNAEVKDWKLALKGIGPDANMIGRGTVWSRRLTPNRVSTPTYDETDFLPIRVQCREIGSGGLSPDEDIRFAIAVSFEVEGNVRFDVYNEIRDKIRVRTRVV